MAPQSYALDQYANDVLDAARKACSAELEQIKAKAPIGWIKLHQGHQGSLEVVAVELNAVDQWDKGAVLLDIQGAAETNFEAHIDMVDEDERLEAFGEAHGMDDFADEVNWGDYGEMPLSLLSAELVRAGYALRESLRELGVEVTDACRIYCGAEDDTWGADDGSEAFSMEDWVDDGDAEILEQLKEADALTAFAALCYATPERTAAFLAAAEAAMAG